MTAPMMMLRSLGLAAGLIAIPLAPVGPRVAMAQEETLRIAAVVNDEMISVYDLAVRTEFVITTSGQESTESARRRLAPQVLRELIDELLEIQEAKTKTISVTDGEVDQAIGQLEDANRVPRGTLNRMLTQRGLPRSTLSTQIRARLLWEKLISREIHQGGAVSDEDIDQVLERVRGNRGKPENEVAEIVLAVDRPEAEAEVRAAAQRLVDQVRQGGSFSALAQQLSDSVASANGGDLGWVRPGQLDPEIDAAIAALTPGQVSDPIRTLTGVHVIMLRDRRITPAGGDPAKAQVEVARLLVPLKSDATEADVAAATAKATATLAGVKTCADLDKAARLAGLPATPPGGLAALSALPPRTAVAVANLKAGQSTGPGREEDGVAALLVCRRVEDGAEEANREAIRKQLYFERLEAFGRRYLRDLRQAAYIDIRQ